MLLEVITWKKVYFLNDTGQIKMDFFWLPSICVSKLRRSSIKLRFPEMIWKIAYVSQIVTKKKMMHSIQNNWWWIIKQYFNFNDLLEYIKTLISFLEKFIFDSRINIYLFWKADMYIPEYNHTTSYKIYALLMFSVL